MSRVFVIGGEGFVGQAYVRLAKSLGHDVQAISRANYADFKGQACDILINANGNSKKFLSDRDPVWDFDASAASVVRSLEDFKADRYVLLSSGDVYPDQSRPEITLEVDPVETRRMSRYGLHKFVAETMVRSVHKAPLVMRMGGFVGPGMIKNAIFDMLNNQQVWLHADSELQFISTDQAARLVWDLIDQGVANETVNLGARGVVRIGDLFDRIKPSSEFAAEARKIRFELSTEKLQSLCRLEIPSAADEVSAFLTANGR